MQAIRSLVYTSCIMRALLYEYMHYETIKKLTSTMLYPLVVTCDMCGIFTVMPHS